MSTTITHMLKYKYTIFRLDTLILLSTELLAHFMLWVQQARIA